MVRPIPDAISKEVVCRAGATVAFRATTVTKADARRTLARSCVARALARRATVALLIAGELTWAAPGLAAAAAKENAVAEAKRLFSLGDQAFNAEQYATAHRLYSEANELVPNQRTVWLIARSAYLQFEHSGRRHFAEEARRRFQAYVENPIPATSNEIDPVAAAKDYIRVLDAFLSSEADTPAPPPATELMVTCDVPGARIAFEDEPGDGRPSPRVRVVSPSLHRVRITAPGHRSKEKDITAVEGRLVAESVSLESMPGSIEVEATETGAVVHVDGLKVGTTPFRGSAFTAGDHEVTVRANGYRLWSRPVHVTPEGHSSVLANLETTQQRRAAWYTAIGAGATLVAGIAAGLTAMSLDSSLGGMPQGTNQERQAYDDALNRRDVLATSSTVLLSVGGLAAVVAGTLYWFDTPPQPNSLQRASSPSTPQNTRWLGGFAF